MEKGDVIMCHMVGVLVESLADLSGPLVVRSRPGTGATCIGTAPNGIARPIIDGPAISDDGNWWKVDWGNGLVGWSVQKWLMVVNDVPVTERLRSLTYNQRLILWERLIEFAYANTERCQMCGNLVSMIWTADESDWKKYHAGFSVLCPRCFDALVEEANSKVIVRWVPRIEGDREDLRDMGGSAFVEGWMKGETE